MSCANLLVQVKSSLFELRRHLNGNGTLHKLSAHDRGGSPNWASGIVWRGDLHAKKPIISMECLASPQP